MTSTKQVFAEAQAVHEGDRAALLAAINEAAANMGQKKVGGAAKSSTASAALMQKSGVNANIARDLVSNAGASRVGDMADFADAVSRKSAAE